MASESDVKQTVSGAQSIFQAGTWSRAPAIDRSKVLSRIARALEERIPELAQIETLQTGRTIREMKAQLTRLPEWMYAFSPHLRDGNELCAAVITMQLFCERAKHSLPQRKENSSIMSTVCLWELSLRLR